MFENLFNLPSLSESDRLNTQFCTQSLPSPAQKVTSDNTNGNDAGSNFKGANGKTKTSSSSSGSESDGKTKFKTESSAEDVSKV